jgi:hypothetical protein
MNPRRMLIVAVLAVIAITSAIVVANFRTESPREANELLYPELKAQADSVKAIRIFKAGDARALEIVRAGDRWTLTERNGYPIAAVKARNLVRALANAEILEEKTADESKYAALSVEDVKSADAKGIRVEFEGPGDVVNLIVGKDGPGGKSSFVRRVGEQKSWLVNEQLNASPEARDWLDKDIVNISADRIQSATISTAGLKAYAAAKASRADADFKVEALPRGKELSSPSAANAVATALLSLTLDDVLPKSEVAADKAAAQATYRTFDGLIVQLEGFRKNEKHYITLSTSYDQALADRFKLPTTVADPKPSEGDAAKAEDGKNENAQTANADAGKPNVEDEAKQVADKVGNWAYEIPQYKYDALFRPLDEMLKK